MCVCVCVCVCVRACVRACMWVRACMCAGVHVSMCGDGARGREGGHTRPGAGAGLCVNQVDLSMGSENQ